MSSFDSSAPGSPSEDPDGDNADAEVSTLLRIGERINVLPVIHGSGQFAMTVRRWMLEVDYDCVAVPLPPSFREQIEEAVLDLPKASIVIQPHATQSFSSPNDSDGWKPTSWQADESDDDDEPDAADPVSYVPIDPCQPVIMAIRAAMGEHISRQYIDLETDPFRPYSTVMPDPYAVRHVRPERFAAALLPSLTRPHDEQTQARIVHMASRLRELETRFDRILLVCSVLHWPWIREAYDMMGDRDESSESSAELILPEHDDIEMPVRYGVDPRTLTFLFGELPFITGLYERARSELEDDDNLQIDGVKELLIAARGSYQSELGNRARKVTPMLLSKCLQYIRNLSLIHRRLTPDLVTIATATQQILGDQFAIHVAENANDYRYAEPSASSEHVTPEEELPVATLGIDQARLADGEMVSLVNRLPGPPMVWRTLELQKRPDKNDRKRWAYRWNPYSQCSYPPEDARIENFRTRVFDRARDIMGNDLAKTEKFTTSVKDGIDIRDTLRHWYEREIYVKVVPPTRGVLDACVMLFDSPADPRDYPWRTTWFAEHENESTLALFATDFHQEMVGPGIGLSVYGGALFLYPPMVIPDVWLDPRLDFTETLEERLIAAGCLHGRGRQLAVLSGPPPGAGFRRLARRFNKQLIHVPLSSFSDEQVKQLRMVHVLNGSEVRSFAESFIRKI